MEIVKAELLQNTAKIYERLYTRSIIFKIILFVVCFTAVFWYIRMHNILPEDKLKENITSIPYLFGAGNLIFSVLCAFIIQAQWTKWDRLIDANRGEINMLRQLFIFVHHFPKENMNEIRYYIYYYLKTYIEASNEKNYNLLIKRSKNVDEALTFIEDSVFNASKKSPEVGTMVYGYLTRAMEYREKKIQLSNQRLPWGIKLFVIFATASVVIGSLFVPFNSVGFNYYFALVVALLSFGVYMIIEDFDHPYRPGSFVLTVSLYRVLMDEVEAKLRLRGFDIEKEEAKKDPKIL